MSQQAVTVVSPETTNGPRQGGFMCFCGNWFPRRELFDEHLKQHPDGFVVCDCCKRILPKGSWIVDENGTFVWIQRPIEDVRLESR